MRAKSKPFWPLLAILLAAGVDLWLPDAGHQPAERPYLRYVLAAAACAALLAAIAGRFFAAVRRMAEEKAAFYAGVFLLLAAINGITKKFDLFPALFFPSPDRVLGALARDWRYIAVDCLGSSAKLLATGYFAGVIAGLATGIAVGFNRTVKYWVSPLIRLLGPMPPTAWIPLALVAFPTTFLGGAFLIALSVWFPVTLMTSSGIANVSNAYFEVSSTLGAGRWRRIFGVGVPAAMPSIFIGLFTGTCSRSSRRSASLAKTWMSPACGTAFSLSTGEPWIRWSAEIRRICLAPMMG